MSHYHCFLDAHKEDVQLAVYATAENGEQTIRLITPGPRFESFTFDAEDLVTLIELIMSKESKEALATLLGESIDNARSRAEGSEYQEMISLRNQIAGWKERYKYLEASMVVQDEVSGEKSQRIEQLKLEIAQLKLEIAQLKGEYRP